MEFHFLFPGLEKSWNLTPGFGKLIKVMEIIKHSLAKPHGSVSLLNPAYQHRDIDISSMKIEINLIFLITLCLNWLQLVQGMACLILPPCLGTCLFHAIIHVKGPWFFSFGHWIVMEKSWKNYCHSVDTRCVNKPVKSRSLFVEKWVKKHFKPME